MNEMIERAARAIAKAEGRGMIFNPEDDWYETDGHRHERNDCYAAARAAIEAMRMPSPAMQAAGAGALGIEGIKSVTSYGAAGRAWLAMINAALEEKEAA